MVSCITWRSLRRTSDLDTSADRRLERLEHLEHLELAPGDRRPEGGGGGKFSSASTYFYITPRKSAAPKKPTPLVFPYLPWIVVGVEKVAICLEWSGTPE